jgi:predicted RNA-binding Zn ribbon-like protein
MTDFVFVAGAWWLDLVNTVVKDRSRVIDLLPDRDRLAAWLAARAAHHADVLTSANPVAEDTYRTALELRELLRQLAENNASGADGVGTLLPGLNSFLDGMPARIRLEKVGSGVRELVEVDGVAAPLYPVVRSAIDYLGGTDRVRRCENPRCILYFLETPRTRRRRWCSMSGCGNRMKAARHYRSRSSG